MSVDLNPQFQPCYRIDRRAIREFLEAASAAVGGHLGRYGPSEEAALLAIAFSSLARAPRERPKLVRLAIPVLARGQKDQLLLLERFLGLSEVFEKSIFRRDTEEEGNRPNYKLAAPEENADKEIIKEKV